MAKHTKQPVISTEQQWVTQQGNEENNSTYNTTKKNMILQNKFGQGDARCAH